MAHLGDLSPEAQVLLTRLRAFCFPGGEDAARSVRAVRNKQRGEFRTSPVARWMPFTAEEEIDATSSRFRWDARFGSITVTDAYEEGHGRLVVKLGGWLPVKKSVGPEFDKGELQRYLGAIVCCPPALLNHGSLEWKAAGPSSLRVRDRNDLTGATVELDLKDDGQPLGCRAERPRVAGKATVLTAWSTTAGEFRECEGIRLASRLEAAWQLPEGRFAYFRGEVISFAIVR